MSAYRSFTSTRVTEPDPASLLGQLRALDATAGVQHDGGTAVYIVKKATTWTAPQVAAAQRVIDIAPAATVERAAQAWIDTIPLYERAIVLTLLDQINVLRAALPTPLAAITPAQALAAIRAKAGVL